MIHLPFGNRKLPQVLRVEGVGPKVLDIKPGNLVILDRYTGTDVEVFDDETHTRKTYTAISAEHVLAIWED